MIINGNSIVQYVIQIKNGIMKHVNVNVKSIRFAKKKRDYSWNPSTCICENSKYLKSIVDTSVTECDKIVIVMDNVSTKKTNTIATKKISAIATNFTKTASISCHSKRVRDFCFAHSFISDHITIDN